MGEIGGQMNRLQEISNNLADKILQGDHNHVVAVRRIVKDAYGQLLEALKPEIELMLKEQAKMVRDATVSKIENVVDERRENGLNVSGQVALIVAIIQSSLDDLQHDWVKLEDK